ncbi:hypothetical protein IX95_14965 [Vibrio sp. B183]|nr:hypothetical protein IX95_14965 [Vibrio sp. B183]
MAIAVGGGGAFYKPYLDKSLLAHLLNQLLMNYDSYGKRKRATVRFDSNRESEVAPTRPSKQSHNK